MGKIPSHSFDPFFDEFFRWLVDSPSHIVISQAELRALAPRLSTKGQLLGVREDTQRSLHNTTSKERHKGR